MKNYADLPRCRICNRRIRQVYAYRCPYCHELTGIDWKMILPIGLGFLDNGFGQNWMMFKLLRELAFKINDRQVKLYLEYRQSYNEIMVLLDNPWSRIGRIKLLEQGNHNSEIAFKYELFAGFMERQKVTTVTCYNHGTHHFAANDGEIIEAGDVVELVKSDPVVRWLDAIVDIGTSISLVT